MVQVFASTTPGPFYTSGSYSFGWPLTLVPASYLEECEDLVTLRTRAVLFPGFRMPRRAECLGVWVYMDTAGQRDGDALREACSSGLMTRCRSLGTPAATGLSLPPLRPKCGNDDMPYAQQEWVKIILLCLRCFPCRCGELDWIAAAGLHCQTGKRKGGCRSSFPFCVSVPTCPSVRVRFRVSVCVWQSCH